MNTTNCKKLQSKYSRKRQQNEGNCEARGLLATVLPAPTVEHPHRPTLHRTAATPTSRMASWLLATKPKLKILQTPAAKPALGGAH